MKRASRHFQSSSQDVHAQLNDPGIYYIYEKGHLLSPPGYSRSSIYTMSTSEHDCTTLSRVVCYTVCSEGPETLYKPIKLLDICYEFVAKYIEYVDSLEGFPELIGHQLLKAVIKHGRLKELNGNSQKILNVFSQAYGNIILDKLTFKNCGKQLERFVETIQTCFSHITVLDLHGCRIGETHEMIDVMGQLSSLRQLGLCHNALSDHAIQKMTAPMRMFQRGPVRLEALDLSCNPQITEGVIRYILAFSLLTALDLSGTSVKVQGLKKLEERSSLRLVPHQDLNSGISSCVLRGQTTSGWLAEVVNEWMSHSSGDKKAGSAESQARQFYSRKKIRRGLAAEFMKHTKKHENTPPKKPVLIFKAKPGNPLEKYKRIQSVTSGSTMENNSRQPSYNSNVCNASILQEIHLSGTSSCLNSQNKENKATCILSQKSQPASRTKQKLTLASAIELLTEDTNSTELLSEERHPAKKRKMSNDGENGLFSEKGRHYSIEEQDLIGQYFSPSTPIRSSTSLIDAMLSPEWQS